MHRPTLSFAPPTIASSTSPGRLRANNIEAIVVDPGVEARHPILELIREGAEVACAVSKRLEDIGSFAELRASGAPRCAPTAPLRRAGNGEKVSTTVVPAAERDGTAW